MSASVRQSELFAGNDWTIIYRAFTSVNLNAFDYNSILQSMVQYINQNYPEVFNDWTDNDEYLVLIQLISNIAESIAFRMDLNARENFFDLARRRESILRLARFLSYSPKRNLSASGLMKIVSVQTTDNIYDSNGNDLSNIQINWNDSTNQNWYEQFITVLNSSFVTTNPFGTYLSQIEINNITYQLYRFNNIINGLGVNSFYGTINGTQYPFEIVNTEFNSTDTGYQEVEPDLVTPFQIIYSNDNNGNASINTGFFSMFKQGTLNTQTYSIDSPIQNRTIDIGVDNINQNDLWVQTVNDSGYVTQNGSWERVGYVPTEDVSKVILTGDNITYNSIPNDVRNIYQDITQVNDDVVLRFGDGRFGNTPTGNLRVWYRVSANENLVVTPDDFDNIVVTLNYYNSSGVQKQLTLTYSLEVSVSNASVSETTDQIRQRVGAVYATQGRMVSGDDYNSLPLSNQEILKIKAINRIYSGQSRYIDLNDPTGTYQNVNVFCDDGAIYSNIDTDSITVSTTSSYTISDITDDYLTNILSNNNMKNFIFDYWINNASLLGFVLSSNYTISVTSSSSGVTSGNIVDSNGNIVSLSSGDSALKLISVGAMAKFEDSNNNVVWATVTEVNVNNVTFNNNIPNGYTLKTVLPIFRTYFTSTDITNIKNNLTNSISFGIGYDYNSNTFYYIDVNTINLTNDYTSNNTSGTNVNSSWLIYCEYSPVAWRIYYRNIDYVFESDGETKFFYSNTVTGDYGETENDEVKILKYNFDKTYSDIYFDIKGNYIYSNGDIDYRKVYVDFVYNGDNPNNPESFNNILNYQSNNYVFHKFTTDANGMTYWELIDDIIVVQSPPSSPASNSVYYSISTNTFTTTISGDSASNYKVNMGMNPLSFMWKHYATDDHRIDPSISNIIDIYVLTNFYYNSMLNWRNNGTYINTLPTAPTEIELSNLLSDIEEYKMFSDTIIWKPVNFKLIGGVGSDSEYMFTIKVIKLNSSTISDGQLRTNIVTAINKYFDINNGWDFGDTFYASELIAYLHIQLADSVASVVLVPNSSNQNFGDLFQIDSNSDELFFPTITVNDVEIITNLTSTNMRIS